MSAAARIVLAALVVALVGLGGAWWWVTQEDGGPDLEPTVQVVAAVAPGLVLDEVIQMPADPLGCPGYSFQSTVPLREESPIAEYGASATSLDLGEGVYVLAVCFGPVDEVGALEDLIAEVLEAGVIADTEIEREQVGPIRQITSGHGDGPALTTSMGTTLLTDHYVVHDGYVHVVGLYGGEAAANAKWDEYLAILATWQWAD